MVTYLCISMLPLVFACSSVQQVPSAGKDECYPYEHPYSPSNDANLAFSGMIVST